MASSVLEYEQFYQILKDYKKRLTAQIDFDDVEDLLIKHNCVRKDEFCSIGEVIVAMICHHWSLHKCIQVFKVIKEHPKYVSCACANLVINELEVAESSYSTPEQVESSQSEEEDLLLRSVRLDRLTKADPELEKLHLQCIPTINKTIAEANQIEKCVFNSYLVDGYYKSTTLPKILEKYLPQIIENCGMYVQVISAGCIEMLEKINVDDQRIKLGKEADKINELFKKLRKQAAPIDIKKVLREDLLPCMNCIGSIVNYITKPPAKPLLKVVWESLRFKLIDTDNLRMLCYYKDVLDYLLNMVAFLIEIDSKSPISSSALKGLQIQWVDFRNKIMEAKKFYDSADTAKQARMRGWGATVAYSGLAVVGIFIPCLIFHLPVLAVGAAGVAGSILLRGILYTESYIKALPDTVQSFEAKNAKEFAETLDKIPVKGLKKFCTDLTD